MTIKKTEDLTGDQLNLAVHMALYPNKVGMWPCEMDYVREPPRMRPMAKNAVEAMPREQLLAAMRPCYYVDDDRIPHGSIDEYDEDFAVSGPLLEEHRISVYQSDLGGWSAMPRGWLSDVKRTRPYIRGSTFLVAGMRALVAGVLGDEVELPC